MLSRYLLIPLLRLLAFLPLPVLYGIGNFLYLILYYLVGYRKKVISDNLQKCFPEWDEKQRKKTIKDYYHYLCDLSMETIKLDRLNETELKRRVVLSNPEVFERLNREGKSCVVLMSHYCNWEWVCAIADASVPQKAQSLYKTLSDPHFEKYMNRMREQYGTMLIEMNDTLRVFSKQKGIVTASAFLADQSPSSPAGAAWIPFFGVPTAFMQGPEKIARKMNMAVVYLTMNIVKKGFYRCDTIVLTLDASKEPDGFVMEKYAHLLEAEIRRAPKYWVWSHRRWKHSPPSVN